MADPKNYISVLNDGTNDLYIKDAEAQQAISDLQKSVTGAMHFLGLSTTAISDEAATGPWTIESKTYIASGTPAEGEILLKAGDAAVYAKKEFVWNGSMWREYGDLSSLKSLAYKDASDIETGGSTSTKLATTSITGVSGSTTVTGVDGSTTVTGVDGSTSVYGCGENTTVHDTPTLNTSDIYGCGENVTVHDTPSLTAGTLPSMTYDSVNEKLTFAAGAFPTIVAGTEKTVATKAATATAVGTSLTAGTEKTVATKAAAATTVPVAAAAATTVPVAASSATTVPTAAGSATVVATGGLDNNDANGSAVVTAVSTTIQNKASV